MNWLNTLGYSPKQNFKLDIELEAQQKLEEWTVVEEIVVKVY